MSGCTWPNGRKVGREARKGELVSSPAVVGVSPRGSGDLGKGNVPSTSKGWNPCVSPAMRVDNQVAWVRAEGVAGEGDPTGEGRSEAFEVEQELNRPGQHKSDTVSILPLWIYEPRLYRVFPV